MFITSGPYLTEKACMQRNAFIYVFMMKENVSISNFNIVWTIAH